MGTSLRWSLANPFGIRMDEAGLVWHAGRVNDVLKLEHDTIVVGTAKGGVWLIDIDRDKATPLSGAWDNPDITCLALGPDAPHHIYAGAGGDGGLYVTSALSAEPLFSWRKIDLPARVGAISRIVVLTGIRRIVLASSGGLWWAPIPQLDSSGYEWTQVTRDLPAGRCFGLAEGPNNAFVVTMPGQGLFRGRFVSLATVEMEQTFNDLRIGNVSVASCAVNRLFVYAAVTGGSEPGLMVLASLDGGSFWTPLFQPRVFNDQDDLHGDLDAFVNSDNFSCIAVAPNDPSSIALGWVRGVLVSNDTGRNWQAYSNEVIESVQALDSPYVAPSLERSCRAVLFSDLSRLYIASDGGIVSADVGTTGIPGPPLLSNFNSGYNRNLANLEFRSIPVRSFMPPPDQITGSQLFEFLFGSFDVRDFVIAGGLVNAGSVFFVAGTPSVPWRAFPEVGGSSRFVSNGDLVLGGASRVRWNASSFRIEPTGPRFDDFGARSSGHPAVVEAVPRPALPSAFEKGSRILAVGGVSSEVFGLFSVPDSIGDTGEVLFPEFLNWDSLGSVPLGETDFITAIGSYDGLAIYVGTKDGRIFRLNPQRSLLEMTPRFHGAITRLVIDASSPPGIRGFALANNRLMLGPPAQSNAAHGAAVSSPAAGTILELVNESTLANQGAWARMETGSTPGDLMYDLAVDWASNVPILYLATEDRVYVSYSEGSVWEEASAGLPAVPHCSGLCLAGNSLYLTTCGRSLWMVPSLPEAPRSSGGGGAGGSGGGGGGGGGPHHNTHPILFT